MDTRAVEETRDWEERPFGGGFDGLHALADAEFTGCVEAGDLWLCMLRGRVVGVFERREEGVVAVDIDRFEDASGTAYEAPEPGLPLLFAMQASEGEERGRYYTEDTPIEQVDAKLSEGGFTGYLELSENVLSGDYYVVYHAGRSRQVAFVGQSRRLFTDEEAFERACDEVGIYTVTAVDLDVVEIPEPAGGRDAAGAAGAAAGAGAGAAGAAAAGAAADTDDGEEDAGAAATDSITADIREETTADDATAADTTATDTTATDTAADDATATAAGEASPDESAEDDPEVPDAGPDPAVDSETGPSPRDTGTEESGRQAVSDVADTTDAEPTEPATEPDPAVGPATDAADPEADGAADAGAGESAAAAESPETGEPSDATDGVGSTIEEAVAAVEADLEEADEGGDEDADPADAEAEAEAAGVDAEAGTADGAAVEPDEPGAAGTGATDEPTADEESGEVSVDEAVPEVEPTDEGSTATADGTTADDGASDGDSTATADGAAAAAEAAGAGALSAEDHEALRRALAAREAEVERLEAEMEELETELRSVRDERDDLVARVEDLEDRLQELGAGAAAPEESMSPDAALAGTSLFVRYRSKGAATLGDVNAGEEVSRSGLKENLRLERHTSFDDGAVAVDGRTFDAFLEGTQEFRFVRWLVTELPFEIAETGGIERTRALYDALGEIDRVEFDAAVEVVTEAGEDERRFDVVARDRMGEPLLVASLEDSRDPVQDAELGALVTDATDVARDHETLAAAVTVTTAFFEPSALSTAEEATSGSLLSRDSRASFVKVSRKRGFHLCLIEDREESFYLSVPEL